MLVLTRRVEEEIVIGDDIVVKIIELRNGKVRIGVEAPKDMPVHRREVWLRIQNGEPDNGNK